MCHVLRGVQQEKAKLYALSQLDPSCGFWLSDWAQKVIPSMFREGQRDYLGKKGMSVHVDVLLTKAVASSELMSVYFTTIYRCDQDVIDTLCVAEHVLKEVQKDHPNIKQLFRKTDNAGCYSGNSVAEIEYSMCRQNGFTLLWHDYNESQKGKDQADRESAVAKKYMNGYLNSGHDITPEDIKKGILYLGGPADTKVSVIEMNKNDCHIVHSKIPNIQSFHSVAL